MVAAELSKMGLIASPTSRSAIGADILVTDQQCSYAWSVQVKTNAKTFSFWLLSAKAKDIVSRSHVYALVNLRSGKSGEIAEYFIVPSHIVAQRMVHDWSKAKTSEWFAIYRDKVLDFQNNWPLFSDARSSSGVDNSARKNSARG